MEPSSTIQTVEVVADVNPIDEYQLTNESPAQFYIFNNVVNSPLNGHRIVKDSYNTINNTENIATLNKTSKECSMYNPSSLISTKSHSTISTISSFLKSPKSIYKTSTLKKACSVINSNSINHSCFDKCIGVCVHGEQRSNGLGKLKLILYLFFFIM